MPAPLSRRHRPARASLSRSFAQVRRFPVLPSSPTPHRRPERVIASMQREHEHKLCLNGGAPLLRRTAGIDATLRAGPPPHDRRIFAVLLTHLALSSSHLPRLDHWFADQLSVPRRNGSCTSSPWSLV